MTTPQLERKWDPSVQWDPQVEEYLTIALGAERLRAISTATVRPPLSTCLRVNTLRTTPEDILRRLPAAMAPDDRQVLANSGRAPYIHPQLPMAVMVPGSGPHSIDYTETEGRELIVGRKAGEAMLRGANAYAPGILAVSSGIAQGDLMAVSVGLELPGTNTFGVTRGTIFPPNLPLDDPRFPLRQKLFLGVGRAEVPRSGMNPSSQGLVVSLIGRVFSTPSMGDIFPGEIMLQNLPSLVAAMVLGPTPGSRVLDMCAAPGGKATAMAQMMGNKGEVIALDRSHSKVVGITKLAEELGITCIKAYKHDATKAVADPSRQRAVAAPESEKSRARRERIAAMKVKHGVDSAPPAEAETTDGFAPESFDYVLLDVPCTALGLRPRLVLPQQLEELHSTALYQRKFLDAAVRLVRPGGYLVFSTCTINPAENEANVRYVLDKYGGCVELVQQVPRLGGPGLTRSVPNDKGGQQKLLSKDEAELVQRFDPSGELDTIGFFIAKFRKISSINGSSDNGVGGEGEIEEGAAVAIKEENGGAA